MARLIGFALGELRGKIGGNVFSRNKSGAYVRARVTPVNPQTARQQSARYRFGNMSILYQSISAGLKDCWEGFARTHFNPLKGNSTGIYSGGNAFVALRQSAMQGNTYRGDNTGISDSLNYVIETTTYEESNEPPDAPTSATIIASDGSPYAFSIDNIIVTEGNTVSYDLKFPNVSPTSTETFNKFSNVESQDFGIGFYMSNNLKFPGAKPNTALKLNFADTGIVTNIDKETGTGAPKLIDGIRISTISQLDKTNTRDYPCVGDHILVTPFVRSSRGAQKLLAPFPVTVQ